MVKLWFHLPWLWLKRDILLLCLCVFPDPRPAGSPGTGLCRARAGLSDSSLAERLCLGFSGFPFLSLSFPLAGPTSRLLFNHTSLWWPWRRECQAGRSGLWEVGRGRSSPFSHISVSCCWPWLGEDALTPCSQVWSSVPPFHPDTHCCMVCGMTASGTPRMWGILCPCCCFWRYREGMKPP